MNRKLLGLAAALLLAAPAFGAGGTIRGTIAFTGPAPAAKPIDKQLDPNCSGSSVDEEILLSKDGKALRNVVVRVKGLPASPPPKTPVVLEQKQCLYLPRVQGAVSGQQIQIRNEDGTLHNVHAYVGKKSLFNVGQPPGDAPVEKAAPKDSEVVRVKCDVHPWMRGWVVVNPNGFFAVSGEKGTFEIPNVPPGKYTVEAWHESLGTQTAEVTVVDGKPAEARFSFSRRGSLIASAAGQAGPQAARTLA